MRAIAFLLILLMTAAMPGRAPAELRIAGPVIISLRDLEGLKSIDLDGEVEIHLPSTIKTVVVEKREYSEKMFEDEIRAYTLQQAVFWTLATLVLASAVERW